MEPTAERVSTNVRGKIAERARARELRAEGKTYPEIARALGVSKSSVERTYADDSRSSMPPIHFRQLRGSN